MRATRGGGTPPLIRRFRGEGGRGGAEEGEVRSLPMRLIYLSARASVSSCAFVRAWASRLSPRSHFSLRRARRCPRRPFSPRALCVDSVFVFFFSFMCAVLFFSGAGPTRAHARARVHVGPASLFLSLTLARELATSQTTAPPLPFPPLLPSPPRLPPFHVNSLFLFLNCAPLSDSHRSFSLFGRASTLRARVRSRLGACVYVCVCVREFVYLSAETNVRLSSRSLSARRDATGLPLPPYGCHAPS